MSVFIMLWMLYTSGLSALVDVITLSSLLHWCTFDNYPRIGLYYDVSGFSFTFLKLSLILNNLPNILVQCQSKQSQTKEIESPYSFYKLKQT